VSREHAEMLSHATLTVLADRIGGGQALDLAAMLPEELGEHLRKPPSKTPKNYGFDEFVVRVHDLAQRLPDASGQWLDEPRRRPPTTTASTTS
jgi:uncharacterized protein (DUF2267 family)